MSIVDNWNLTLQSISKNAETETREVAGSLNLLFTLDPTQEWISVLGGSLKNEDIRKKIQQVQCFDGDWPAFDEVRYKYLCLCRDFDPSGDTALEINFDLYGDYLQALQVAFNNPMRGHLLARMVKVASELMARYAVIYDAATSTNTSTKSSTNTGTKTSTKTNSGSAMATQFVSTVLLKMFNAMRAERIENPSGVQKRDAMLVVASVLCRLYFAQDKPLNCGNVFSNMHTAELDFHKYSMAAKVEYRFWLGRFYLVRYQLREAYKHLIWAFDKCLATADSNKRIILIYLSACGLALGKVPQLQILRRYRLDSVYGPLISAYKRGHWRDFCTHLDEAAPFFIYYKIHLLLKVRCKIIVLRRALQRLYTVKGAQTTTLTFSDISAVLGITCPDNELQWGGDFAGIEALCVSLISQGLVKANIFSRVQTIKFKSGNAFPNLAEIYHVTSNDSLDPIGHDAWMNN